MRACLGGDAPWVAPLAERCARMAGERWRRLSLRGLAELIEHDAGYRQACRNTQPPRTRRYLLRVRDTMQAPPLGLDDCQLPFWPHTGALAQALGVPGPRLWRLTRSPVWQRRWPLGDQHYRCRLLAKPSGGWRLLEVPSGGLMNLQRRLLHGLLDRLPPHEAAFGFSRHVRPSQADGVGQRTGSVVDHARAHTGQAVVLKFDLQDFFSSVRASRVHALFATLGYAESVARELAALCTTATPEAVLRRMFEEGGLSWMQMQRLRDPHLPQGAPTSAAVANLCAFRLDLRLDGLAQALGARYTRYADDIVLSGDAPLAAARRRIEAWVGRIALEEGFALNHRKTRCQRAAGRQSVCSVVVNRHTNLPRPEFDRLKAILHLCLKTGPAAQNRQGLPNWREHLQGRVAWAAQLNPAKAQRLQRLFAQIDWRR
jgi:hypothetical protein